MSRVDKAVVIFLIVLMGVIGFLNVKVLEKRVVELERTRITPSVHEWPDDLTTGAEEGHDHDG